MDPLSDLHILVRVADAGSFAAAAQQLNASPSSVSKRISRMENRLGVRLFNRTTRSLAITEAGRTLYQRGQDIVDALKDAEAEVKNLSVTPQGRLRVACSNAFAMQVLLPQMPTFRQAYPEVTVTLVQGDGPVDLIQEEIDVAIRFEPPGFADFVATKLMPDPWVICASPQYLRQHGHPQTPQDLRNHQCLTIYARTQDSTSWTFHEQGTAYDVEVPSVFSAIGLMVKQAALEHMGVARLANFLVADALASGALVPLLDTYLDKSSRWIYAVYPNRQYLPLKVRVFIDAVRNTLAQPDH